MLRFSSYDILFGNYLLEIWNMYTFMDVWKYPFHWLLERYIFRPENHYPVCRTADGVCLWWLSDGLQTSGCEATIRPLPCDTSDDHWPLVTWSGCHQPAVRILIGYNHQTLVASDCKEQTCRGGWSGSPLAANATDSKVCVALLQILPLAGTTVISVMRLGLNIYIKIIDEANCYLNCEPCICKVILVYSNWTPFVCFKYFQLCVDCFQCWYCWLRGCRCN